MGESKKKTPDTKHSFHCALANLISVTVIHVRRTMTGSSVLNLIPDKPKLVRIEWFDMADSSDFPSAIAQSEANVRDDGRVMISLPISFS